MIAVACIAIVAGLIYWYYFTGRDRGQVHLPPGPTPLPIIGNFGIFASHPHRKTPYVMMQDLCRKYGPIMSLQLGGQKQIVFEEYETIRELLSHEAWVNRHFDERTAQRSFGKDPAQFHLLIVTRIALNVLKLLSGVLLVSGDVWKEMRRFSLRTLRDFGFGKQISMDATIQEELALLMADLNSRLAISGNDKGIVVPMHQFFTISILNILWNMIAGFRFSHTDVKLKKLLVMIDQVLKENSVGGAKRFLHSAFPFLNPLWNFLARHTGTRTQMIETTHDFFREFLEERRAAGTYQEDQRDFMDVFLSEIDSHAHLGKDNPVNHYTDEQFLVLVKDLFMAGSETTANTTEFAILYMMLHPEVQRKVQAEIDQVVGPNRAPTMADKSSLPYTEATLWEVQRMASVLPLIVRSPNVDTKIGEYRIPKDTIGLFNLYSMHKNPATFPNPHEFNLDRFYDAASKSVVNAHKIMPFGFGKRVCLGEVLAKTTLFTYFTTLLQQYSFSLPPNLDPTSDEFLERMMEPVPGFTLSPKPYSVCIKQRLM